MSVYEYSGSFEDSTKSGIKDHLHNEGIVIVRGIYTKEEVEKPKRQLLDMFGYLHKSHDGCIDYDKCYESFWKNKPDTAQHSLTLGRDLPSYMQIVSGGKMQGWISHLLDSENLFCPYDWCIFRIDGSSTQKSRFEWHQDYTYNVISTNAITFWVALSDMRDDMGLLHYISGSHNRIEPVVIAQTQEMNNPNRLCIADLDVKEREWEKKALSTGPMKAGDVLFFNSLLLHRSGFNESRNYRWVANGRYARSDDPELRCRNYYTARIKYPNYFETAHPELVLYK